MSSLWKMTQVNISKRPSPRQHERNQRFVRNRFIKRISLSISRLGVLKGSMTVEATVILPLFLLFFLNLGSAIEMMRLHSNLEFALCDIGNRMAVYGYALDTMLSAEEDGNKLLNEVGDVAYSYFYVKKEIVNNLGEEYLEASPLANGVNGLQFLKSEIFQKGDCFEIVVNYHVSPFGEINSFPRFLMSNRYYGHLWNGYGITETAEDVVYVTENGVVYHEDADCSHLRLMVREVSLREAYVGSNSNGIRYKPCQLCMKGEVSGMVFITEDGDRIHSKKDCSGLKRTVYEIPREEASKYAPCSRCGGER